MVTIIIYGCVSLAIVLFGREKQYTSGYCLLMEIPYVPPTCTLPCGCFVGHLTQPSKY